MTLDDGSTALFALVLLRVSGMLAVAPLSWQSAPTKVRAALALLAAAAITPSLAAHGPIATEDALVAAPGEILLGVAIGMVPRMLMSVSQMVGDVLTPLFGMNGALLFGSAHEEGESPVARLMRLLISLLAVTIGLHRVVLAATLRSFAVIPPGAPTDIGLALGPLVEVSTSVVYLGARLAMPLIAVHLATQTALAWVSRAAPAMQVFSIGFAASIFMGFSTLVIVLPDEAHEIARSLGDTGPAIERVLTAVVRR